jgi:hypothetical protein
MPITVLEHVKGSELPASWKKKTKFDPEQTFTITIKPENEEEDMPPEEMISDELIKSVKRSEADQKAGRYTRCRSKKEREAHYKKVLDE